MFDMYCDSELFTITQFSMTDIVVSKSDDNNYIELTQDGDMVNVKLDDVQKFVDRLQTLDYGMVVQTVDFDDFVSISESNYNKEYVNIGDYEGTSVTIEKSCIQQLINGLKDQGIAY